ncbi:DUF2065 family protein [Chachezhania antarctica]|uniref:DUF2065 family protein n=1 Tax=Chachezhania antarctica TaxID=2340860 RepID=UPI000EAD0502|nr:DUF2065 family protein [Chachezhania antarctica]|tara:strand:- start:26 stop:223 length:198 start_codon:yes stop_codon:yes gene_type:complete
MAWLLLGLGLVLLIEGLVWAMAPGMVERMLEILRTLPEPARPQAGLLACVLGLILIWLADLLGGF